jgi:hypothetical protein
VLRHAPVLLALLAAGSAWAAGPPDPDSAVDEDEVIRAPRPARPPLATEVAPAEAAAAPGSRGDPAAGAISLPGVGRPAAGSEQLIVWGAAPRDTRILVDGVEIPALFHVGGLRSTLGPALVGSLTLVPGGFGAEYGRALGGLLLVDTRAFPEDGVHGFVAADLLDASALVSARLGERLRVAVSGRYGYLDRILERFVSPDVRDFFPLPRYDDYQLKATLALRPGEELQLMLLGSDDHLTRSQLSADPAAVRRDAVDLSFYRAWLRYTRLLPDGSSLFATPWVGLDRQQRTTAFGAVPTVLGSTSIDYGLRTGWRGRVHPRVTLVVGLDLAGARASIHRSGTLTLPPREGDISVFGLPPPGQVATDAWTTQYTDLGPHLIAEVELGRLRLTTGLRLDVYVLEGSQLLPRPADGPQVGFTRFEWSLDPRLAAEVTLHERLRLIVLGGLYQQPPAPEDLSSVFGNPLLGLERGGHAALSVKARLTSTLTAELTGYGKLLWQLGVRNPAATPPLAQALIADGEGRVAGASLVLRQELWKNLSGWLSYALSRSERLDHGATTWRLSDFDQTHVLGLVVRYVLRGFGFGARLRYASGFPRTAVTSSFYDASSGRYQPLFGPHNSTRLPDFVQLDLRVDRTWRWPRWALEAYVDVQNVTYRHNAEELVYSFDFSRRDYITGLPTLAVAGVKVSW